MSKTEFEIRVKDGTFLGEIIVGLLVISGSGSVIVGTVKPFKTVNFIAKTYRRINFSPEQVSVRG